MQCLASLLQSFHNLTTTATKPLFLAFDRLVLMVTTGTTAQDFEPNELHFVLIGVIATFLVALGLLVLDMICRLLAKSVRAVTCLFTSSTPSTKTIECTQLTKHALKSVEGDIASNAPSALSSSASNNDDTSSTIINNYTTHIHGPIINMGADAVGSLRKMLELGSGTGRLQDADFECDEEEEEEEGAGDEQHPVVEQIRAGGNGH